MKFLIAGLGSIGRRHMRNLLALGERDIVLVRSGKSTLPDDELAGFLVEHDIEQALERHQPDAVIVSTPSALHLDAAIPAARAGCAILLEKPISNSSDRLDELQAAVRTSGSKILVGFQFRFHPGMVRAKQLISDGEVGRVLSAHVHFGEYLPSWHPWEDYRNSYAARADLGGGVLLTQCHALDYLPWLVGHVETVIGFTARLGDLEIDVDDTAELLLQFSSGALGSMHLDFNQQPPSHHFEIIGTNGSLEWDLADGATRIYRAEKRDWQVYPLPAGWERNAMFIEQMKHFVAVVRGDGVSSCGLEDGVRVQRLVGAIRESNDLGRRVNLASGEDE